MAYRKLIVELTLLVLIDASVIGRSDETLKSEIEENEGNLTNVFNGVYTECFLRMSYTCVQNKTLLYLKELNKLTEVSVIGDYVKFVKLNTTEYDTPPEETMGKHSEDLAFLIDSAVDKFFTNHVMKFSAMGRDISVPNSEEGFVGRKKRKGGGGGGGHGGGGGGHDDGGKKKMMMMAMMCMKMKLMMMVPAMMGMMGMMSFKGMMFSMMSFMISKMMLLMKLLEKKGAVGGGGGGGGGVDAAWQAGGGGGGAWMPAGGDYGGGGGGGGGYDANGQWQSRSIYEKELEMLQKPVISYVKPTTRLNNKNKLISRKRRGIIDVIQNAYEYWINRILGSTLSRRKLKQPNYKIVNGVKYVYYPMKMLQKVKSPKEVQVKTPDEFKPIVIAEDYNKGEIVEGPIESRMNRKKFSKIKDTMNETMDENPWE